jgi:uncharacterized protein
MTAPEPTTSTRQDKHQLRGKFDNDATFVLLVSRLCNLRCRYCYLFPDLANPRKMNPADLGRVFTAVVSHFSAHDPLSIRFAWQGGEPLIHPPAYYREALALQKRAFADSPHRPVNVIQTNLTLLDEERIQLLVECFDGVGVSHDVVGNLRVDAAGRSRVDKVVENLDRLRATGVPMGGITVLTRQNVGHIRDIYEFWKQRRMPFRLLPVHQGPFPDADIALTPEQVRDAFRQCFDLWLADDEPPPDITPISEMIEGVLHRNTPGATLLPYDKNFREWIYILDDRGFVGGLNEELDLEHAYGNILESSLEEILAGPGHQRSAARAAARIEATCTSCPFFRTACSGHPIGEGVKEFTRLDENGTPICTTTRGTLAHIERRLVQLGLIDVVSGESRLHAPAPEGKFT